MPTVRDTAYLLGLVNELSKLPVESEWVEFKRNNAEPEKIGGYISALSNSAALLGKEFAYMLWGLDDATHAIVGTSFDPGSAKCGNEELENWLARLLTPKIHFAFHTVTVDGKRVVLLEIAATVRQPVRFMDQEFIRSGSYTKKLKDFPEKERALWRIFDQRPFEPGAAVTQIESDDVLKLLDYPAYFDLADRTLPDGRNAILDALDKEELIAPCEAGGWNITNLGAVLFAKRLDDFPTLRRKALRIIQYKAQNRLTTLQEKVVSKGYANGFAEAVGFIMALVPANEVIGLALRREVPAFPPLAVRELVANALIHQDFTITGTGPMVEIFTDRIEVTNPGAPLVDTLRFVDTPPKSRNEALASLMRRLGICEERGSGIDKVVSEVELYHLPAPIFEALEGFTRTRLFAHRPLNEMDREDRVRACYLHACLKWVNGDYLTNASLRERFGVEKKNKAAVSRYIREALEEKAIRPFSENAPPKLMKYVPVWA